MSALNLLSKFINFFYSTGSLKKVIPSAYRRVVSLKGDKLIVFHFPCASENWPDKRDSL
jgi:hypothetical protein